jgi:hypothetical protein
MKKFLTSKTSATGTLIILSFILIFHLLVISGVIPFNIVWGGNVYDKNRLLVMETISIAVNLLLLLFVCAYLGIIKIRVNAQAARIGFWTMFILFSLNTLGNSMSKNPLEFYIFTPLTLLLSLFCFRVAAYRANEQ